MLSLLYVLKSQIYYDKRNCLTKFATLMVICHWIFLQLHWFQLNIPQRWYPSSADATPPRPPPVPSSSVRRGPATSSTLRLRSLASLSLWTALSLTAMETSTTFHPWQRILGTGRRWTRGKTTMGWATISMCAGRLTKGIQQLVHAQVRRKQKDVVLHFATDPIGF